MEDVHLACPNPKDTVAFGYQLFAMYYGRECAHIPEIVLVHLSQRDRLVGTGRQSRYSPHIRIGGETIARGQELVQLGKRTLKVVVEPRCIMEQIFHNPHFFILTDEFPGVGIRHHHNHRLSLALPYQLVHHLDGAATVIPGLFVPVNAVQQIQYRIALSGAVVFRRQIGDHPACLSSYGVPELAHFCPSCQRIGKAQIGDGRTRNDKHAPSPVPDAD